MGRIDRVNQEVKKEVSRVIFQELSDPRLSLVTITSVDVSRDLRNAKIKFSVLGEEKQIQAAQNALNSARGLIRKFVGKNVRMRYTPEINFEYDQSLASSARIDQTLQEIDDERQEDHSGNKEE
ncbi:MAG: 30S ribosome-binding factor RbfA [Candidatus Omnitrophica bacterium]|nr:30S ribosome-binding factor RbfA [Candidatus Omnitrophota bacterium]